MPKVTALTSERELFIMINDLSHLRIDRRELIGIQSWTQNRGRGEPMYQIEFYTKSGPTQYAVRFLVGEHGDITGHEYEIKDSEAEANAFLESLREEDGATS